MDSKQPCEMTQDELLEEALRLSEQEAQTYLSPARKQQVGIKLGRVLFEIRYQQGDFRNGDDAA